MIPDGPGRASRMIAVVFSLAAVAGVAARVDAQVTTTDTCRADQEQLWDVAKETLGLFVTDEGRDIGGAVATVKIPKGNGLLGVLNSLGGYHPVSGSKQLACGTVKEWTVFKLGRYERDLHPHVQLSGRFKPLLDEPPFGERPDETCEGCLWGEVTVPQAFSWVWQQNAPRVLDDAPDGSYTCGPAGGSLSSPKSGYCAGHTAFMTGGQFCMYGPWVMEGSHADRAEIHPVQAFWGQSDNHAKVYFTVDASRRFERPEHFGLQFLSQPFRSWGQLNAVTLYQVVRVPSATGVAQVVWDDHPPTARTRSRSETNTDLVAVRSPQWAIPRQVGAACRATDGTVQVLLAAAITMPAAGWRGLNVSGSTGLSFNRPPPPLPGAPIQAGDQEPRWRLAAAVEWNRARPAVPMVRKTTAHAWGVLEDETKWMAVPAQNYRLDLQQLDTPETSATLRRWPEGLRTDWTISVFDLDKNAPTNSGVTLTLGYPRNVPTTVSGTNVTRKDISPSRPFALVVRFDEGQLGPVHARVPNLRVTVAVTASAPGVHLTDRAELLAMAPDFVSKVSGFDLETGKAAFPEALLPVLAKILQKDGCPETTFRRELAGALDAGFPIPSLTPMVHPRLRLAGIVRQAVNKSLHDKTMDFGEFRALLKAFWGYRQACKPSP